jgi:hypothetical protein
MSLFEESLDKVLQEAFAPGHYLRKALRRKRQESERGPKFRAVKGEYGILFDPDDKPLFMTSKESAEEIRALKSKIFTILQEINEIAPLPVSLEELLDIFNKGIDLQLGIKESLRPVSVQQKKDIQALKMKLDRHLGRLEDIIISARMKENLKIFKNNVNRAISRLMD